MNQIGPQQGPQTHFLECDADVVFYGGAAGGGKTYALLLEPLYDVSNSKFGAVIFRRTTKQVRSEGGLWDTATELYSSIGADLNQAELKATFPSGAKVTFAHMEHDKNRYDWQGSQIPLICFDEITHFTWKQVSYMFSRNRSTSGAKARIRGTCNPDPDHWIRGFIDWWIGKDGYAIPERSGVIRYFIINGDDITWADSEKELLNNHPGCLPKSFTFIKSSLDDNKILVDADPSYRANLEAMNRVEREQLLGGNWNIRPSAGMYFRRSYFEIVDAVPAGGDTVRAWDQAATKPTAENPDPDWTVGLKMNKVEGIYYIEHVERFRDSPGQVDQSIKNTAISDGKSVTVRLAQDPGQAGKSQASQQVKMLAGFNVKTKPVTGDKVTRAKPLSSQAEAGNVKLLRGPWNEAFITESEAFSDGAHEDQVDAAADAFDELTNLTPAPIFGTYGQN